MTETDSDDPLSDPESSVKDDADRQSYQFPLTERTCAGRRANATACPKLAETPCPKCLLVAYCGSMCRKRHWPQHKAECLPSSPSVLPPKIPKAEYSKTDDLRAFWARYPATDIINLARNEGSSYEGPLSLLILGEFGLRHFIYSVAKLPKTAKPRLRVVLNEYSPFGRARTLIALFILCSDCPVDPVFKAEAIIHYWYSTTMPKEIFDYINTMAEGFIRSARESGAGDTSTGDVRIAARFDSTHAILETILLCKSWRELMTLTTKPSKINKDACHTMRSMDVVKRSAALAELRAKMTPARWACLTMWNGGGLLLPYGAHRDHYDHMNPLFYRNAPFPPSASDDPIQEWPREVLDYSDVPAPNDVHGKMFFYLRDLLVDYQAAVKRLRVTYQFSDFTYSNLTCCFPNSGKGPDTFDRIEVGDAWDANPLMGSTIAAALLRHQDENPHATALAMTRYSVDHVETEFDESMMRELDAIYGKSGTTLDKLAPPVPAGRDPCQSPEGLRRREGLVLWRDWDGYFRSYLASLEKGLHFDLRTLKEKRSPPEGSEMITTPRNFHGLVLKQDNTVTTKWPNRLVHGQQDTPIARSFNRLIGWPNFRPERWMEWKLTKDMKSTVCQQMMLVAVAKNLQHPVLPLTFAKDLRSSDDSEAFTVVTAWRKAMPKYNLAPVGSDKGSAKHSSETEAMQVESNTLKEAGVLDGYLV